MKRNLNMNLLKSSFAENKKYLLICICLLLLIFLVFKLVTQENVSSKYLSYQKEDSELTINGDYLVYVELGSEYKDLGARATNDKGQDLSKKIGVSYYRNGSVCSKIDTNILGNYLINYKVVDYKNKSVKEAWRVVIVRDTKSPKIVVPNVQTIKVSDVKNFDLLKGVSVSDKSDDVDFRYENTLKDVPGDYIVTYTAIDSSGNKSVKKRLIKVK